MKFQLPQLPWEKSALEPFLSAEQVEEHYQAHHKSYIDKVNEAVEKQGLEDQSLEELILHQDGALYNNAAQAWNHTFFWMGLTPEKTKPGAAFERTIGSHFGTLEDLKKFFIESAGNLFGSGWTWFVANENSELAIVNTRNGDNPLRFEGTRPLWACDVWEHAYYIDYKHDRKKYLEGAWDHINWAFVEDNLNLGQIPNMSRYMNEGASNIHSLI